MPDTVFPSLVNINTDWEQVDKSLSWLPELLVAAKKKKKIGRHSEVRHGDDIT